MGWLPLNIRFQTIVTLLRWGRLKLRLLDREEVVRVLAQLSGANWIVANLLYGSGLRG